MPVPSCVRDLASLTRWKRSKTWGSADSGMPMPVSETWSWARSPRGGEGDRDAALESVLERVGEEIEDDLLPHVPVDVDHFGKRRAVDGEGEARFFDGGAEDAGEFGGVCGEIGGLIGGLDAAGFDAGEIEEGVDEFEEAEAVAVGGAEALAAVRRKRSRCARLIRLRAGRA